jgi:hypothetical protein
VTRAEAEERARNLQAESPERDDPRTGHERPVPGSPGGVA